MVKKEVRDHLGNVYSSISEMSKEYHMHDSTVSRRLRRQWDIKKALTYPTGRYSTRCKKCTDQNGKVYSSIMDMCYSNDITIGQYYARIKSNGKKVLNCEDKVYDYLQNEFNTVTEMCDYYGVSRSAYYYRIKQKQTVEQALTKGLCTDHLGNTYNTLSDMCNAYNIKERTYKNRVKNLHWNKKKALTKDVMRQEVKDHLGNVFNSQREMCRHYGVNRTTFRHKLSCGMPLEEALLSSVRRQ